MTLSHSDLMCYDDIGPLSLWLFPKAHILGRTMRKWSNEQGEATRKGQEVGRTHPQVATHISPHSLSDSCILCLLICPKEKQKLMKFQLLQFLISLLYSILPLPLYHSPQETSTLLSVGRDLTCQLAIPRACKLQVQDQLFICRAGEDSFF